MLKYTDKQWEGFAALTDPQYRNFLFDGGARSGKTDLIWEWIVMKAWLYPGSEQIILRKFKVEHRGSIWRQTALKWLANHFPDDRYYTTSETEMFITFWNGSIIRFDGCDDEARIRKIFGAEYITVWFNEASEIDFGTAFDGMTRAVQKVEIIPGQMGNGIFPDYAPCQCIFDTNPQGRRHWLYKAGVQHRHPETGERLKDADKWKRVGGWVIYHNAEHLAPDAIEKYEALEGVRRKRLLDGEWCSAVGNVYSDFSENIHVCKQCTGINAPDRCPRIWKGKNKFIPRRAVRGIDFGYRDPFVCLWAATIDEQLLFYKCWYKKQMIVSDHAVEIKKLTRPGESIKWTVADHDAEDAATLRKEGIRTRSAKKDKPIMAGIDRVIKQLKVVNGKPGLQVCQYCTPILDEFSSYMMNKNSEKDEPEDGNDHTLDPLRYMVAELFGRGGSMLICS